MDINWLQDFICLGRTLSFTRAAEERHITQSAFSRRIKALEHWVGVPLVDRANYPVTLSEAGRLFLPVAHTVLAQLSESRQLLREREQTQQHFVKIAGLHTISVHFLTDILACLNQHITDLRVQVISDSLRACCRMLAEGDCDFLLYYRHDKVSPLLDEARYGRKDIAQDRLLPVALASAVERHGWQLPTASPIPCLAYDPSSFLGSVVGQLMGSAKPHLEVVYIDALVEAIKSRMLEGGGMAWLPASAISAELASGRVRVIGAECWQAPLTVSLFCSPSTLSGVSHQVWEQFESL